MGVITYLQEITSVVAPSRLFKALVTDSHNVLPRIVPEGIKSAEFIKGDGGVGTIKKTNFGESSHIKYTKHKINALNADNLYCQYTMIESDIKFDKIDFVAEEVKFAVSGSGCLCKMTSEYHVKKVVSSRRMTSRRVKTNYGTVQGMLRSTLWPTPMFAPKCFSQDPF